MRFNDSLASRHFFASAIILPILLGFSALAFERAFHSSLLSSERESLKTLAYLLLGAAEPTDTSLFLPDVLAEPRFSSPQSGLYGVVYDERGAVVWRSPSMALVEEILDFPSTDNFNTGDIYFAEMALSGEPFFQFFYDTLWEIDGRDQKFRFVIYHSQDGVQKELKAFRGTLWKWLGGLALLLSAAQLLIARWGLQPLRKLAADLNAFQEGHTSRLEGRYPKEIRPVTSNLNRVLESEKSHRQRYKNTLGDLAHSLKTPLAIIRSALEKSAPDNFEMKTAIDEQVSRMSDIVGHQLRRASLTSTNVNQSTINIHQIVERLGKALAKVYEEKHIIFENRIDNDTLWHGEESDAMELFGNVVENAFKYGRRTVIASGHMTTSDCVLTIEDDGPGVPEDKHKNILSRGARADTANAGQGIGLAITVDIVSSYGGSLRVGRSDLGGAKFTLTLPLAK